MYVLHVILALMNTERKLLNVLLAVAAIFYLVFIFRTAFDVHGQRFFTLVDDAMVSMRYARNLAQGHGLVWNLGQPPVEGFTNLGWVLLMALVHLVPLSPALISLVIMLLAAALLLANSAVIFEIVHTLDPSTRFAPLIAASLVAFYFPLVFWTLRGLEVGALTLSLSLATLFSLCALQSTRKPIPVFWLTLSLCVALLLRMDALIACALILLYLASKQPRAALIPAIVTLTVFVAILLFQKSYFGDYLPNTYYLKIIGVTAWERIRVGLLALNNFASHDFLMPLFVIIFGLVLYKNLRTREMLLLLSLFFAQVGYSVWVGGDYAEDLVNSANRFITQGMPALFILFALVVDRFIQSASGASEWDPHGDASRTAGVRGILSVAIGLGALFVVSGQPWTNWVLSNAPMLRTDIQRVKLGLHIKEYTDPRAVIAVHAAGQIPYFSERTTIDLLGKSDPVIAKGPPATEFAPGHNKWNYTYSILQLRPDLVADNFNKLSAFMDSVTEYLRLPNGIYVRRDSTHVNLPGLGNDYH